MVEDKLHVAALNKSFVIKHSNKNMKASYRFQLEMAKAGDIAESDDVTEQFKKAAEYSDILLNFPTEILKLTDSQRDKLDDMEQIDLQDLDVRLALTIQGIDKKTIDETIKEMHQPVVDDDNKSVTGDSSTTD